MSALSNVNLTLVECMEDAENFMRWLGEGRKPVLGLDTETGGLDFWREPLRTVQIGDANSGWVLPYDGWGGLAKEAVAKWEGNFVCHNAKFDLHFLREANFKMNRSYVHDTRVMTHLYDNIAPTALKSATARYIDKDANQLQHKLDEGMSKNGWSWRSIPVEYPYYWMYAALDPVLTVRLYDYLWPQIQSQRDAYDIEIAAQQVLMDAEARGIKIDVEYCHMAMDGMTAGMEVLENRSRLEFGIDLTQKKAVIEKLTNDGVEFSVYTDGGQVSLKEEALEAIDHPLARMILDRRHLEKISGTYLKNFLNLTDDNGFLHPSINILGARTGRMSVGRPSLQNLERSSDVRNAFVPREGNRLLLVDYDQIEMRLLAHFAAELLESDYVPKEVRGTPSALVDIFTRVSEVDAFTAMTREIYEDDSIPKNDHRRQMTKNGAYARIYGAGLSKYAQTVGVSYAIAEKFMNAFNAKYPEIDRFLSYLQNIAGDTKPPSAVTPYGRRLQLHERDGIYKIANYLIQGTAAQVLKERLVQLDVAGLSEHFILPVHDEFVFDVPENDIEELQHAVINVVEERDRFKVPITAGAKTATRWGEHYPAGRTAWSGRLLEEES